MNSGVSNGGSPARTLLFILKVRGLNFYLMVRKLLGADYGEICFWDLAKPSSSADNGEIFIWDLAELSQFSPLKIHGLDFYVTFLKLLASGADNGKICISDLAEITNFPPLKGENLFLSWNSKVQNILASSSYNGTTVILDLKKQKPVISFSESVRRLSFVLQWSPFKNTKRFSARILLVTASLSPFSSPKSKSASSFNSNPTAESIDVSSASSNSSARQPDLSFNYTFANSHTNLVVRFVLPTESSIERVIFDIRFLALLAIGGSVVGSLLCFLNGCIYIVDAYKVYWNSCVEVFHTGKMVLRLVEAIDVYLARTVLLIFGIGLYGLFINNVPSTVDRAFGMFALKERPKWMKISSLDELKTKVGHVIVMILLV